MLNSKFSLSRHFEYANKQITYHFWLWVSFIGGRNRSTRWKPQTYRKLLTNFITLCCIEYTSPWTEFELTTLVVIGTDCIDCGESNYHMIMTTMAPYEDRTLLKNVKFSLEIMKPKVYMWIINGYRCRVEFQHRIRTI